MRRREPARSRCLDTVAGRGKNEREPGFEVAWGERLYPRCVLLLCPHPLLPVHCEWRLSCITKLQTSATQPSMVLPVVAT